MKKALLFVAIIFLHLGVNAQNKPAASTEMNVDLPDETEEASLVDKGSTQLETALLLNRYHQESPSVIGQILLRIGLSDRVELRALLEEGKNRDIYFDQTVQSTMPLGIGSKISLVKDHSWLPDMTFVGQLCLPVTSKSSRQREHWSPILLMAFENKLSPKWKLEYNAGDNKRFFLRSGYG